MTTTTWGEWVDYGALAFAYRTAQLAGVRVRIVIPPVAADEPITLEDAWYHCRIDTDGESPPASDDDAWLTDIGIPAARAWAEGYSGLSFAPQTLELVATGFPTDYIELPGGPVQSITSVIYIDADEVGQTMDPTEYELDASYWPARLYPNPDNSPAGWPATAAVRNPVRVRYVTGYIPTGDSPADLQLPTNARIAMLLMLAHLYENREDASAVSLSLIPTGARQFLDQIRVRFGWA